jgi:hypothetical protein
VKAAGSRQGGSDLDPWLTRLREVVAGHALAEPGTFARWRCQDASGSRNLASNPYGCADAANLLYTLGELPAEPRERASWVAVLQGFQDPKSGLFREATHHPIHTTAHCLGALELFDARPSHPLSELAFLEAEGEVAAFLDALAWREDPWLASHEGAGIYAARWLAGEASADFADAYFDWLSAECDPTTGMWRRGCLERPYRWGTSRFPHLAGTFHYLFNHEHARRPLPYPAALVETCLDVFAAGDYPLGSAILGFAEVDWVYCTARAMAQSGHRKTDAEAALRSFAARYVAFLEALDWDGTPGADDLHALFGAVCALAELQRAVPGLLRSRRPLRLVLDRRPFI